jgi:hypothetical protein
MVYAPSSGGGGTAPFFALSDAVANGKTASLLSVCAATAFFAVQL